MEYTKRTRTQRTISYILGTMMLLSVVPMSVAITQGQVSLINQLMADIKSGAIKGDAARKRAHTVTKGLSATDYMIEKLVDVAENAPTPIPNILGEAPAEPETVATEKEAPKQGKMGQSTSTSVEKEVPQTLAEKPVAKQAQHLVGQTQTGTNYLDAFKKELTEVNSIIMQKIKDELAHPKSSSAQKDWSEHANPYTDQFLDTMSAWRAKLTKNVPNIPKSEALSIQTQLFDTIVNIYVYRYLNFVFSSNAQLAPILTTFIHDNAAGVINAYTGCTVSHEWVTNKIFAKIMLKIMATKVLQLKQQPTAAQETDIITMITHWLVKAIKNLVEVNSGSQMSGRCYATLYTYFTKEDFDNINIIQNFLEKNPLRAKNIIIEPDIVKYLSEIKTIGLKFPPQQQPWMKPEKGDTEKQKQGAKPETEQKQLAAATEKAALIVPLSIDSTKIDIKLLKEVINNLYALYEKIKNRAIEECSTNPFTKAYRASNVHIIALCKDPYHKSDHFENLQLDSASHKLLAKMKDVYTTFCTNNSQTDINIDLFEATVVQIPKDLKHADPKKLKMSLDDCKKYLAGIPQANKLYIDKYALDFYKKAEDAYTIAEKEITAKKSAEPVPTPQPEQIKQPEHVIEKKKEELPEAKKKPPITKQLPLAEE